MPAYACRQASRLISRESFGVGENGAAHDVAGPMLVARPCAERWSWFAPDGVGMRPYCPRTKSVGNAAAVRSRV